MTRRGYPPGQAPLAGAARDTGARHHAVPDAERGHAFADAHDPTDELVPEDDRRPR